MAQEKSKFTNSSGGFIGVVRIENGKERGVSVRPNDSVWLSEEEQVATANAPRNDADNPFTNGFLTLETSKQEMANHRPIGDTAEPQVPVTPDEEAQQAERQREGREKAAAAKRAQEEARLAAARRQAEQPAVPQEETGAAVPPGAQPRTGKRAASEEVATPEAPARAG